MISMIIQFGNYQEKAQDQITKYENFDALLESGLQDCLDETLASIDISNTVEVLENKVWTLEQGRIVLIVLVLYIILESIVTLFWHRYNTYKIMDRRLIAAALFGQECEEKELRRLETVKKLGLLRQKTDRQRTSHIKRHWDDSFDTDESMNLKSNEGGSNPSANIDDPEHTPIK